MNFMPGWFPAAAAAGAGDAGISSIAHQSNATSTSSTITAPADIQKGDLLVLSDMALSFGSPTAVIPSGFTTIVNTEVAGSGRTITSYKIADGSEASASLTGMSGDLGNNKVLAVFRPDVALTAVTPASINGQGTSGNPSSQVVTASGGTAPLIVFGCYGSSSSVAPRTMSPAKDGEVGASSNQLWLAWKIYNSSPADVAVDMDDEGGINILQSFYLELA